MTNRSVNGTPTTYTVNDLNELTGSDNLSYDANGNRVTVSLNFGSDWQQFFYDDENRLVTFTYSESGQPLNWWDAPQTVNDHITHFVLGCL